MNLYVISEDSDSNLEKTNTTVKENLKTWLNKHRMINDSIDILNAQIVNFAINFTVVTSLESNKYEVLNNANRALLNFYSQKLEIGESFFITEVYSILNSVPGVVDTTQVNIRRVSGGLYSSTNFDLESAISPDGRYILVPDNVILELKYPSDDIRGSVL